MPEEISYIKCDCRKGKLEQIAETKKRVVPFEHHSSYIIQFYGCDSCFQIFTRTKKKVMGPDGFHVGEKLYPFELYKGLLTKEDIIKYATRYETLDRKAEEGILAEKAATAKRKAGKKY
ncbi:hypothetical protein JW756_07030 [Candidatus Woesearchaeota archaeon]|nr:hypothetical protein [Candidatus Woesearchaeota archaeon]